ncbi:hypothetical protein NP511_22595 (plasmid) [Natrinema thermotolerans]|uniref:Uncharacterized protein n=1 Tax=Natrinema thermotolerans TaxID=121872 RepID=A0AAF0PF88_9EURY|nr:hypothetical protein [Natrinema thermotolerans]WMT10357.1 hypothetical protein NP511_22595 [Natrinema thermotolerans]
MTSIKPQSGIQLIIIIGAGFLFVGTMPNLGMMLLTLGVGFWVLYNIINIGRQF